MSCSPWLTIGGRGGSPHLASPHQAFWLFACPPLLVPVPLLLLLPDEKIQKKNAPVPRSGEPQPAGWRNEKRPQLEALVLQT